MIKRLRQNLLAKGKNASLSSNPANHSEFLFYCLLLLFLPTQFGKHFWPNYAYLSGFRVDYLSPTLYATDLLIITLAFVTVVRRRNKLFRHLRSLLSYLLVIVFLLLSLPFSPLPWVGLYMVGKVLAMLFVGWYTYDLLRKEQKSRDVIVTLLFSLTVVGESLIALTQLILHGSIGGMFYYLGERTISSLTPGAATTILNGEVVLRSYGTFSHPNVLAGFLLLSLVFIMQTQLPWQRSTVWLFKGSLLVIGTLGLLTTLSRIPLILWGVFLIVSGIALLRMQPLPYRLKRQGILVLVIGVGSILLMTPLLSRSVERVSVTKAGEEAFVVRADLNRIALFLITDHPFRGVGLGSFLAESLSYKERAMPLYLAVQPVHNLFLLVAAETGVLGLFLLGWFVSLTFFLTTSKGKVLLAMLILLGSFDHYLVTLEQGQLMLAFFTGYCWVLAKRATGAPVTPP